MREGKRREKESKERKELRVIPVKVSTHDGEMRGRGCRGSPWTGDGEEAIRKDARE